MVSVSNLNIAIRGNHILSDISMTLKEGRIYALLGENGSGKTTLLRALTSYYPDYDGSILYSGKELKSLKRRDREALHAILPQSLPLSDMTVESLLSSFPDAMGYLKDYGLELLSSRRVNTLSGGEQEMVFLSLLLSRSVLLYALDEVEASLGMRYKRMCAEAMLSLKERKKIVLASFHDLNRAFSVADELIVLSQGRLVFKGGKEDFIRDEVYSKYFDLRMEMISTPSGRKYIFF